MRVFVAIEISDDKIINSIKILQSKININASAVKSQNFHFTLQFLGEVSEELSLTIIRVLDTIEFCSFNVNVKGIGVFPRPKAPRIVWVGVDDESKKLLIQVSKKVEKALEPLGLFLDKPFKPHVTIFRIKKKIGDITKEIEPHIMKEFGMQKVTTIKFKKSELTQTGPIYTDLARIDAVK